jgi:hypothetical protein
MIRFQCPICNKHLRIPESHAGKQGRCPGCREQVTVPEPSTEVDSPIPISGLRLKEERVDSRPPHDPAPEEPFIPEKPKKPTGHRRYPWLLDVLLYPTSIPGLINILIFWLVPTIIALLASLPLPLWWLIGLLVNLCVWAYLICYMADCMRDSAEGGTRGPENMGITPDLRDAVSQCLYVVATALLFGLPTVGIYFWRGLGPVFWTAVGLSAIFLPMAMLTTIVLDSVNIFRPWLWLSGIGKTLLPYSGLLLVIYLPLLPLPFMNPVLIPVQLYTLMIGMHLLGRFFFRYEERLNWD